MLRTTGGKGEKEIRKKGMGESTLRKQSSKEDNRIILEVGQL